MFNSSLTLSNDFFASLTFLNSLYVCESTSEFISILFLCKYVCVCMQVLMCVRMRAHVCTVLCVCIAVEATCSFSCGSDARYGIAVNYSGFSASQNLWLQLTLKGKTGGSSGHFSVPDQIGSVSRGERLTLTAEQDITQHIHKVSRHTL